MTEIFDFDIKWATLIGRLFIAFGYIEKITHNCLVEWLKDPIYPHIKNMNLGRRIDLVIDLAKAQEYTKENIEQFISHLKQAKTLSEKRNIVAHNPLMLTLFQGDPDFVEVIQSIKKDEVFIEFHQLEDIVLQTESVCSNLLEIKVKFGLEGWEGLPLTSA